MMAFSIVPTRFPLWRIGALLGLFAFLLYLPTLGHGFILGDDFAYILGNVKIRAISPTSLWMIFSSYDPELYIPLTFFSYQIDYLFAGQNPAVYHFTNVLLHALNVFLVTWCTYLLSKKRWVALFCGILFAVHPLHTETVAWIAARKDLLSGTFLLAALIAYLLEEERESPALLRRKSILFFALGLLSKVTIVSFPIALLLVDWYRGRNLNKRCFLEKIPYFILSVFFGVVALFGKAALEESVTVLERIWLSCLSIMFTLKRLFIPVRLSGLHPFEGDVLISSAELLGAALGVILLIVLLFVSFKRSRVLFFSLSLFLLFTAPHVLQFTKGYAVYFSSDKFAYLASIGVFYFCGHITSSFLENSKTRRIAEAVILGVVLVFGFLTFKQAQTWHSSETYFQNILHSYPDFYVAQEGVGNSYLLEGNVDEAIEAYEKALETRPLVSTYTTLGSAYAQDGRYIEAHEAFQKGAEIDPEYAELHFVEGVSYLDQGKLLEAQQSFTNAIEIDQSYVQAYFQRGIVHTKRKNIDSGIEDYERAIEIDPYFVQPRYNLAVELAKRGKKEEAMEHYERVIELDPSYLSARINLGILYVEEGRIDEATRQFKRALRYDPEHQNAQRALHKLSQGYGQ